jgi:MarR family transcriptional regulator for hemolysin
MQFCRIDLLRVLIICRLMISNLTKQDGETMDSFKSRFGHVIHDVARLMRRRFDAEAQRHDLTLPQWRAIGQLSKTDGLSQVTLAGLIDTDPMTLSGLVERMEAKGLVERVPNPDDSRAKLVRITPKSRALVVEMKALASEVYADALQGISEADQELVLDALTRICNNLSTQRQPTKEELV